MATFLAAYEGRRTFSITNNKKMTTCLHFDVNNKGFGSFSMNFYIKSLSFGYSEQLIAIRISAEFVGTLVISSCFVPFDGNNLFHPTLKYI